MNFDYTFLTSPLFFTITFLLIAIFLFIQNKIRMDIIALMVIIAFSLSGILSVNEVFSGFSDPNVILIGLLFIIGEGLVRTGIAYQVSEWLIRVSNNSETKVLVLLMCSVCFLGMFMSSTGIVAIFIPVVMVICKQMNVSPKRLMMPLSFAGLISGMMTLIATPPNLVANAELMRVTDYKLSFFSFTPIGLIVLIMGIVYMYFARNWFESTTTKENISSFHSSMNNFIDEYQLIDITKSFIVKPGSSLIGKNINELHLRSNYGLNIISIERWKRIRSVLLTDSLGKTEIKEKDILLMNISNASVDLNSFCDVFNLEPIEIHKHNFTRTSKTMGMVELTLTPHSDYLEHSIRELKFRSKYNLNVIGLKRNNEIIINNIVEKSLKSGDVLLVIGNWKHIQAMQKKMKNFFVMSYPSEMEQAAPSQSQAPHALLSIGTMVFLMVTGIVPNVIAALIGCLMLAKFRCIDAKSAYNSIQWSSLILIVGMIPFSIALQKTGGLDLAINALLKIVGNWNMRFILMSLFISCAIVSMFISNTATAILMAPIAIKMAHHLDVSPVPFAMTVAISASAAFMTPISSPVNTMVLGLGGYKFSDFVKVGVPFTLLVMLVSIFIVPILFPF